MMYLFISEKYRIFAVSLEITTYSSLANVRNQNTMND